MDKNKERKFMLLVEHNEESVEKWIDNLKEFGIRVRFVTESHVVNEFGKITKKIFTLHCKATMEQYEQLKKQNPFGLGILL